MSRSITQISAPTALDADGICEAQVTSGADDLLINGTLATGGIVTLGEQAHVTLYSAATLSGLTFTVYGATARGASLAEEIAGPAAGTVTTVSNFKNVYRVAVDGQVTGDVTVGVGDALETSWIGLDPGRPLKGISVELSSGASLTYEVQYSPVPYSGVGADEATQLALADQLLVGKTETAGVVGSMPWPLVRLKITSFSAGTATLRVYEAEA